MPEDKGNSNREEPQIVTDEELQKALESHKQWLKKRSSRIKQFNFQNKNFSGEDLKNAVLTEAILAHSNFSGATLAGANLTKASLRGANLRDADLSYANLTGATGLTAPLLAGANLAGAKLPPAMSEFDGVARVDEISKKTGKVFVSMLLGCLYAWLTIFITKDVQLLTNSDTSPLPLFQTQIPIVGFFRAAPIILICLFLYFHLYMQRLWKQIAELPAVFPDGNTLEAKAPAWLLMSILRAYKSTHRQNTIWKGVAGLPAVFPDGSNLETKAPSWHMSILSRMDSWISMLLAWWLVPATLLGLWARCLPRHDWWLTGVQIIVLTTAIGFARSFQHQARITLCGRLQRPDQVKFKASLGSSRRFRMVLRIAGWIVAILFIPMVYVISDIAINGPDRTEFKDKPWKEPWSLSFTDKRDLLWRKAVRRFRNTVSNVLGEYPVANFFEREVSTKPTNWFLQEREDLWRIVEPAHLLKGNLRRANMEGAFLMRADLRGADLREANLQRSNLIRANLRHAQLQATDLRRATLTHADLFRALLPFADLAGADLNFADLREANFRWAYLNPTDVSEEQAGHRDPLDTHIGQNAPPGGDVTTPASVMGADMREADLMGAHLQGVNFTKTDFSHADLTKADLSWANLTEVNLTRTDLTATRLNGSNLKKANLRKSNLRDSIGLTQAQVDQACTSNDTNLPYGLTKPSPCQD